jgi:uncharacterized protein (TIGR00255 family)
LKFAIFEEKYPMIYSMTGFGKAVKDYNTKKFIIEIRSVNSKQFDLSLRIPGFYREKETELRMWLASRLERGKADFSLTVENTAGNVNVAFDKDLAALYLQEFRKFAQEQNLEVPDYLSAVMRMPEVVRAASETISEAEWTAIMECATEAVDHLINFRSQEGSILEKDYRLRIANILDLLAKVEPFEKQRIEGIKERMSKNLAEFMDGEDVDKNRFEQELFYYLEKLDVTEEKVRLKKHCDYFIQTLSDENHPGKKLAFITQEIGREINTLGSKANDADIQKLVVNMKDELEKIKEQLLNVL